MEVQRDSSDEDFKKFYDEQYSTKWKSRTDKILQLPYRLEVVAIMKHLNLSKQTTGNLLDVGCGAGNSMRIISSKTKIKCYGFDISEEIIKRARELETPNCFYESSDGKVFPFQNISFDYVIIKHVLEHVQDPISFLSKISNMIKKGGKLFIASPNNKNLLSPVMREMRDKTDIYHGHIQDGFSRSEIKKMLGKEDFSIRKFKYEGHIFKLFIGRKIKSIILIPYKIYKLLSGKRGPTSQFKSYVLTKNRLNNFLSKLDHKFFSNSEGWEDFYLVAVKK